MKRRRELTYLLTAVMILGACAVRNNPNLSPKLSAELNLAHQLEQNQKDYIAFFTAVGDAERAGLLNAEQVGKLTGFGKRWESISEKANRMFKVYVSTREAELVTQINVLIAEATALYAQLVQQKSIMLRENLP